MPLDLLEQPQHDVSDGHVVTDVGAFVAIVRIVARKLDGDALALVGHHKGTDTTPQLSRECLSAIPPWLFLLERHDRELATSAWNFT